VEIALQKCFAHRVQFAVLGQLEVRIDGEAAPLGGPKQRALLALLLLSANQVVSRDRLVDGLWGERAPASADRSLDSYVSRLRALIGPDRIERHPPGYLIRVAPGELDLERFERLLEEGRVAAAAGHNSQARDRLHEGLGLWRGPALADLLNEPAAASESARLEERRLLALEERIDADLALGHGPELIPELEQLVVDEPYRERPLGQLMVALYRSGRQAEALAAYQEFRRRLAEELGLEPGPRLRELEQRILRQDPELLAESSAQHVTRTNRRRRVVALAFALAAVGVSAVIGVVLGTRGTGASTGEVVPLRLGSAPAALIAAFGHLWTANPDVQRVLRIDLTTESVDDWVPVGISPAALAAGAGSIWTTGAAGDQVIRINPVTDTVTKRMTLDGDVAGALAFGDGVLWVADLTNNSLIEIDPGSGVQRRAITLPVQPTALAIDDRRMWVADYNQKMLVEIDLKTGKELRNVHVGTGPSAVAVGAGSVWVANKLDGTIWRVNPRSGAPVAAIQVGGEPSAIEVSNGSVWAASRDSRTVARINPGSNTVVAKLHVDGEPVGLAAARTKIWEAAEPLVQHRGGTLRLLHTSLLAKTITTIDPHLNVDLLPLVSDDLTYDGLVAYNHVPGAAGTQLVPDLALTLPDPTDGGTTYTFSLRPGIRYSDGRRVRASDFRRSFERLFSLRDPRAGAAVFLTNVVGAQACIAARAGRCDLSQGIVADDPSGTLIIHLRTPDPSFLSDLVALPGRPIPPVPPGTPFRAIGFVPIPGTGPYRIASASPHEVRYVRNPYFREWSHAAQPAGNPNEIVVRFGLSYAAEAREVEEGQADYSTDPIPTEMLTTFKARFPAQLHPATIPTTAFYPFNSRLRPFDDIRVRRALNLAIDRRALVDLYGGPDQATPTCQLLPPGIPGYHRDCPYTRSPGSAGKWTAPNLAEAKRLVAASGTRGAVVRIADSSSGNLSADHYIARVLRRLGYRASVLSAPDTYFTRHQDIFKRVQMHRVSWGDTPYSYFATWFSCDELFRQFNYGWSCDRRVMSEDRRAQSLWATNPRGANAAWARIDRRIVARAALLPLVDLKGIDFVSARVRNYQFHAYSGIIADQLWLRPAKTGRG
jgi:DNA-binding SARP family transcriptional activator/ABC-type transport system substrate-binding protein/streptogramin lyase